MNTLSWLLIAATFAALLCTESSALVFLLLFAAVFARGVDSTREVSVL